MSKGGSDRSRKRQYALAGGRFVHREASGNDSTMSGFTRSKTAPRAYRCSHSITKYTRRWEGRNEFDPCGGWGEHPRTKVPRTSTQAARIEAEAILALVSAFESPEALAALDASAARQAIAAEDTQDTLEAAERAVDVLRVEAEAILAQERRGRVSEDEAEELLAEVDTKLVAASERVERLRQAAESLAVYLPTIQDLTTMSVSLLGISPSDDEWAEVVNYLRLDADDVITGRSDDLASHSVEWLTVMAGRFDFRATLREEVEGDEVVTWVRFEADPRLILSGQPTALLRRTPESPE